MKFACYNHQHKADKLVETLLDAGHERVGIDDPADLLLIDTDAPTWRYRDIIRFQARHGAKVFIYQHGGPTACFWNTLVKPMNAVTGNLVQAKGNSDVLRQCGYSKPVHVLGWWYSDVKPFRPTEGRKVLFAANHPDGDGWMPPAYLGANKRVFAQLLAMPDIELTVRYSGELGMNGLWYDPRATYQRGKLDNSTDAIEASDIVVAAETFAYLAVALGKPCVFMHDLNEWHTGLCVFNGQYAPPLEGNIERYPLQADDHLAATMRHACETDASIATWRATFIGKPFDRNAFLDLVDTATGKQRDRKRIAIGFMFQDECHWLKLHLPVWQQAGVDGFVAVDGGSSDGAGEWLREQGVSVYERPFDWDFSAQANYLLECAEKEGYEAIIRLDPDELMFPDDITQLARFLRGSDQAAVGIGRWEFHPDRLHVFPDERPIPDPQWRIFRLGQGIRYERAVHEAPNIPPNSPIIQDAFIYHYGNVKSLADLSLRRYNYDLIAEGKPTVSAYADVPPEKRLSAFFEHVPFDMPQPLDPHKIGHMAPFEDVS